MEVTHGSDPLDSASVPVHGDPERLSCLADAAKTQFFFNSAVSMFVPAYLQADLLGAFNIGAVRQDIVPISLPVRAGGTIQCKMLVVQKPFYLATATIIWPK